jgi:transcriptional regulator with XRE-family HTH domain
MIHAAPLMDEAYKEKLKQFAAELVTKRLASGLSLAELATRAKTSVRSLVNFENNKFEFRPRAKTIVQLASALTQNPMPWLTLLGYDEITEDKLREIGKSIGIAFPDSVDSEEYFDEIETKIDGRNALLCITFITSGLTQTRVIQSILSNLINACDVSIAIIVPHPHNMNIKTTSKTSLVNSYQAIYNDAIEFARDIILKVDLKKRNKVGFFYPNSSCADFFIPPHVSHSYVRSTLLCVYPPNNADALFELGAWGTTRHNNRDHWTRMFNGLDGVVSNEAEDLLRYWKSYLQEIIENWNPSIKKETLGFWHKEHIPT